MAVRSVRRSMLLKANGPALTLRQLQRLQSLMNYQFQGMNTNPTRSDVSRPLRPWTSTRLRFARRWQTAAGSGWRRTTPCVTSTSSSATRSSSAATSDADHASASRVLADSLGRARLTHADTLGREWHAVHRATVEQGGGAPMRGSQRLRPPDAGCHRKTFTSLAHDGAAAERHPCSMR